MKVRLKSELSNLELGTFGNVLIVLMNFNFDNINEYEMSLE